MKLGFNLLVSLNSEPYQDQDIVTSGNESEYINDFIMLNQVQVEYGYLEEMFNQASTAYKFLQHNRIDNAIYEVLCDRFGMEEMVGLPRHCVNAANSMAYTQVCLEGLGSFLKDICKRIWEFFMKLYRTIMNFFGIRSFRHRKLENELIRIMRSVDKLNDATFGAINRSEFRSNVPVLSARTLDLVCNDMETMYNLLMANKDVENIKGLVNATSGLLTKLGCEVVNEYQIKDAPTLPYTDSEFKEGSAIHTESDIGVRNKSEIISRIQRVLKIQKTLLDIQRWYPANLDKYAHQAEVAAKTPDSEAQKTVQVLNERQKCQAYECKFIVVYMVYVDYLCARTIGSFGIFAKE